MKKITLYAFILLLLFTYTLNLTACANNSINFEINNIYVDVSNTTNTTYGLNSLKVYLLNKKTFIKTTLYENEEINILIKDPTKTTFQQKQNFIEPNANVFSVKNNDEFILMVALTINDNGLIKAFINEANIKVYKENNRLYIKNTSYNEIMSDQLMIWFENHLNNNDSINISLFSSEV